MLPPDEVTIYWQGVRESNPLHLRSERSASPIRLPPTEFGTYGWTRTSISLLVRKAVNLSLHVGKILDHLDGLEPSAWFHPLAYLVLHREAVPALPTELQAILGGPPRNRTATYSFSDYRAHQFTPEDY